MKSTASDYQQTAAHQAQAAAQRAPSYFEKHFALMSGQFTPPEIIEEEESHAEAIIIRSGCETIRLNFQTINSIEAAGDYMCFNCLNGKTHVVRKTMKQLEDELNPDQFIRIHRSNMINKSKISRLSDDANGDLMVILDNGQSLKVSRRYKTKVVARIRPFLYN